MLLAEFLAQHQRVLAYCRSRLPTEQDAQDAAQETYVHVLEHLDRLVDHDHPFGWLFVTARNSCRTTQRRRDRDQRAPARSAPWDAQRDRERQGEPGVPRAKTYQDHEDRRRATAEEDARERVEARGRIEQLPQGLRDVARLAFDGCSPQEIADLLGITRNAVDLRMHRIRRWYGREAS